MIKFFRKIRQNLLSEGKTVKYLKYAVGEIVLVVIGILIAIQLNNLNEFRKERNKESSFLLELKNDINLDLRFLNRRDSLRASHESRCEQALKLFYKAKTVEDILTVDSLFAFVWDNIVVNRKSYDEMLNTNGIYLLKNEKLRNKISGYYTMLENFNQFNREANKDSQAMKFAPNIYPHTFLVQEYGEPWFNIREVDTSWIGDFNSPTYLALYGFYDHAQQNLNIKRGRSHQFIMKIANDLIIEIDKELMKKVNE